MKEFKFSKRERRKSGRATGTIIVTIVIPFLEEKYVLHFSSEKEQKSLEKTKKFVKRHLEKADEILIGASMVFDAEIRASSGAMRRKKLAKWNNGEDISTTFENARKIWEKLEFENDDYEPYEVEI